jgi:hypothetical protein
MYDVADKGVRGRQFAPQSDRASGFNVGAALGTDFAILSVAKDLATAG